VSTLELRPTATLAREEHAALFTRCYEGYFVPIHVDVEALEASVRLWDLDLDASRVLLRDGEPLGLAMLGVRGTRGWVGGMGVVPEWRGVGLGVILMEAVLAEARRLGLRTVDLEVLEPNRAAERVYRGLGFVQRRWLTIWERTADAPPATRGPDAPVAVPLAVGECLAAHARAHVQPAPWQRDLPALERSADRLDAVGLPGPNGPAAYVLYRQAPETLRLMDVGRQPGADPDALEACLGALATRHPGSPWLLVNLPEGHPAEEALRSAGAVVEMRQREMCLSL